MSQPNVLFVLTDDQGIWAAGCYGNPEIRTPNLDRLAKTGTRFEHFFVATPVCSPSRATLLTGRIPSQHGVHDWLREGNVGPGELAEQGREDEITKKPAGTEPEPALARQKSDSDGHDRQVETDVQHR